MWPHVGVGAGGGTNGSGGANNSGPTGEPDECTSPSAPPSDHAHLSIHSPPPPGTGSHHLHDWRWESSHRHYSQVKNSKLKNNKKILIC